MGKFAFPFKLHSILENAEKSNQEEIISWLPSGKAFKIHKPKEFADIMMPQYFHQTKYRSFQRQLYIYGFDRVKNKSSDDYGAYYHDLFVRGVTDLCLDMTRQKIKGTGLSNEERRRKAALSNVNKSSKKHKPAKYLSQNQKRSESSSSSPPPAKEKTSAATITPSSFMSPLSMHPSLDLKSSLTNPKVQQHPRRVSEWDNEFKLLLSSVMPLHQQKQQQQQQQHQQQQQQHQQQQQQQQTAPRRVSEWNNDVPGPASIDPAQDNISRQQQKQIGTQKNNNSNNHQCSSGERGINTKMVGVRRCSLGFVRSVGRRGSLLHDGDEVCFNDKKFFFTTQY